MAKSGKKKKAVRPVPALAVPIEQWAKSPHNAAPDWFKPNPRNVVKHGIEQLDQLCASIAKFGMRKIVIAADSSGMLWAGHGTVAAAKRFGDQIKSLPYALLPDDMPESAKREFMLADNAIARNAKYDNEALGIELADIASLPGADLQLLGFSTAQQDRLIPKAEREGLTDPDEEQVPAAGKPVSRLGDLWQLGEHRLLCGDCTIADHVTAVLGADRPLLMVTDQPYGVELDPKWRGRSLDDGSKRAEGVVANDHRVDWREAWVLFPGDVAYVWHASWFVSAVQMSLAAARFDVRAQIIWNKNKHVFSRGDYHWKHEPCWYAVRQGATGHWAGDRSQDTVWDIDSLGGPDGAKQDMVTGHGTQKPIECMKRPIVNNSREGDAVYEPFSGSGTTIIAAEMTGRRALAIEIDPRYVDVAVRRWERFTGKGAILAGGKEKGAAFAEAAKARGVKLAA